MCEVKGLILFYWKIKKEQKANTVSFRANAPRARYFLVATKSKHDTQDV